MMKMEISDKSLKKVGSETKQKKLSEKVERENGKSKYLMKVERWAYTS